MEATHALVWVAIALGTVGVAVAARRLTVPYPIFVVLFGVAASFAPGGHHVTVSPHLIYLGLLPPLIYYAGFLTSPRALLANALAIGTLAIGLVLATMVLIGAAVHAVLPSVPWPVALVLGAVLAPTDPVAATSVFERVGAPRRVNVLLEGESLLNDGIAFTLFTVAVAAATGNEVTVGGTLAYFVEVLAGSIAVGVAVGYVIERVRQRISDPRIEIALSVVTAYLAFLSAEAASFSGVLATVVTGLWLGSRSEGLFSPALRLQARSFWDVLEFVLNSVLFVLLGLLFREVLNGITNYGWTDMVIGAFVVCAVAIATRMLWQYFVLPLVQRAHTPWFAAKDPVPWQHRTLLGWAGLRGGVSLAAALSIPTVTSSGSPFPARGLIEFFAFVYIYVSLVVQGASLPWVVKKLRLSGEGEGSPRELEVRRDMADAALQAADALVSEHDDVDDGVVAPLRNIYETRRETLCRRLGEDEGDRQHVTRQAAQFRWVRSELVRAERDVLDQAQREGRIDTPTVRRLRRELDLEETRIGDTEVPG